MSKERGARGKEVKNLSKTLLVFLSLLLAPCSSLLAQMERAGGWSVGLHGGPLGLLGRAVPVGGKFAGNYGRSRVMGLVIGHWFSDNLLVGISPGIHIGGHKGQFVSTSSSTVVSTATPGGLTTSKASVSSLLSLYVKWGIPDLFHNLFPYGTLGFGKYKVSTTPADAPKLSKGWGLNFGGGVDWAVPFKEGMTLGIDLRLHWISGGTFFIQPALTVEFLF